jgi:hypothetical protein
MDWHYSPENKEHLEILVSYSLKIFMSYDGHGVVYYDTNFDENIKKRLEDIKMNKAVSSNLKIFIIRIFEKRIK